jgi:hypothetical protein
MHDPPEARRVSSGIGAGARSCAGAVLGTYPEADAVVCCSYVGDARLTSTNFEGDPVDAFGSEATWTVSGYRRHQPRVNQVVEI